MPSSTRGFVYRVVRFSVPVTFPVLTGRAERPRLRDDVGIVPYAGGGVGRFRARLKTQGITGPGHIPGCGTMWASSPTRVAGVFGFPGRLRIADCYKNSKVH